jgi:hypothetical protein
VYETRILCFPYKCKELEFYAVTRMLCFPFKCKELEIYAVTRILCFPFKYKELEFYSFLVSVKISVNSCSRSEV